MLRDRGPINTLGFGVNRGSLPIRDEVEAGDPEAGIVARYFNEHPVQKFFAVAGATIVGASVSGALVRRGGVKLLRNAAVNAEMRPGSLYEKSIKSYRQIQELLDDYEGITRTKRRGTALRGGKLIDFDDPTQDLTVRKSGFFFTHEEQQAMKTAGMEVPADWSTRDEIQQRLVKLSRRMPYELPSVYVTQRMFSDRLLGTGPEEPVNVLNPIDLVGDFAQQTMKNLAFAFVPFEAGTGLAKQGWRKALTSNADSNYSGLQKAARDVVVDANDSLNLIGQKLSDITAQSIKFSHRSTGAMSTAIVDSAAKQKSLIDHLHSIRHGPGGVKGWAQRVAKGEEVFGTPAQIRDVSRTFKDEFGRPLDDIRGLTQIEQIAAATKRLQGEMITDGAFYQSVAATEYRRIVARKLAESGVDEKVATEFSGLANFALPMKVGQKTHISGRVTFGKGTIAEGKGDWAEALAQKVEPKFVGHGKAISSNIERSVKRADAEFMRSKEFLDAKVTNAWDQAYQKTIAKEAQRVLGSRRMAYGEFGEHMTEAHAEFLVRRSAERLGISTHTPVGVKRSTADLKSELKSVGLDPSRRHDLKAFLTERGDISKPWNPMGYNFFGMRAVTVQEALDTKMFESGPFEGGVKQLAAAMQKGDWDPLTLGRTKVGGVYRTAYGDTLDINPLKRSFRGFMDKLADEVQIPLLHVKPLQMLGYGLRRDIDYQSYVQFSSGGRHPFLKTEDQMADGYFWFRGGRAKGRVARMAFEDSGIETRFLEGKYRPMPTDDATLAGRAVRLAAGDTGRRSSREATGLRGILDVDDHQPDSLFGAFSRFINRKQDINNPAVFARRLMGEGDGWRGTQLPDDPAGIFNAGQRMLRQWRNSAFTRNIMRKADEGSELKQLFGFKNDAGDFIDFSRLTPQQLQKQLRTYAKETPESLGIQDDAVAGMLTRAQRNLLNRWDEVQNPGYLDKPLSAGMRSMGLNRRVDEMRMDMMRYLAIRRGMTNQLDEFGGYTKRLLDEVDGLFGTGAIGSKEAAEARAAVGSIHAQFTSLRTHDPASTRQQHLLGVLDRLRGGQPGLSVERVLEDTALSARSGAVGGRIKQRLGTSDYQYDGLEFNPFGDSFTLTPTFGTRFQEHPLRATASALGFRTWTDHEVFSGSGIASTHIFDRMNRAISVLNLGVDQMAYSGPLDLFFRGIMLRRALPMYVAGTTFMTLDRTAGAYVTGERDAQGERIYAPLVTGMAGEVAAQARIGISAVTPWGETAEETRERLMHGEVAVRKGRWWPFGNTPWRGGSVEYYQPSWYRRLNAGYQYTDQLYGSPMEKWLYGYDFSPLRPFDPYRFEREQYHDRPYPVSGDYFTGPWGPARGFLNMTAGRILKPRQQMHEESLQWGMSRFQQMGAFGMAPASTDMPVPGEPMLFHSLAGAGGVGVGGAGNEQVQTYANAATGSPAYMSGSRAAHQDILSANNRYIAAAEAGPYNTTGVGYPYATMPGSSTAAPYRPSNVVPALAPISQGSIEYQSREFAHQLQEWSGIYGFAFGALRSNFGFGDLKYMPDKAVLPGSHEAYGFSRQFWDWNIGGMGDFPMPIDGQYASLEFSEIARRFVSQRRNPDFVNPIPNVMGVEYPWLPGSEYFTNFKTGDPYSQIMSGEMRLPGTGYERFNRLHSDETGRYGRLDRFRILADVAPYSQEFSQVAQELAQSGMSQYEQQVFARTMEKVADIKRKHDFSPYQYRYSSAAEQDMGHIRFGVQSLIERFAHQDTYFHTKLMPYRSALEDWERNNVYGSSFPEWSQPIEGFIKPAINQTADRSPIRAAAGTAALGHFIGATPQAKSVGRMVGGITGFSISALTKAREAITGERYIPAARKQELALEEYTDVLDYVKSLRGFNVAQELGDIQTANQFRRQMKQTMYGADLYDADIRDLQMAMPKRKREHFMEFLNAPEEERGKILSTAGRLERRIYQAAWGMQVEKRPSLEEFFSERELPGAEWEGWDPRMEMELVKLKMVQQQGLNASQMGYYPQQIREANLINPSYPDFNFSTKNARAELERLLAGRGMSGDIREIRTPFPGIRVNVSSGV